MGHPLLSSYDIHSLTKIVQRGLPTPPPARVLPTGLPDLDRCLPGGGFPVGALTELTGHRASGKLSLALALAARVLAQGERVALIDPEAMSAPDVAAEPTLERLLVVRGGGPLAALRATDALLATGAFCLLLIDLPGRGTPAGGSASATNAFVRLARKAHQSATTLVVLSEWLPWRPQGLACPARLRLTVRGRRHGIEVVITRSKLGGEGARVVIPSGPGRVSPPAPEANPTP